MTQDTFHKLVHLVLDSPARPPEKLFIGGMDNWSFSGASWNRR